MTHLTRAQVREIDRRAIEEFGVPGIVLMENAGRGAAHILMRLNPQRRSVFIFCGKGNNGGDGFVIARHLDIHGWPVMVILFTDPDSIASDAAVNYRIITKSNIRIVHMGQTDFRNSVMEMCELPSGVNHSGCWIVDALFGTGLSAPIRGPVGAVIDSLNRARNEQSTILAVDVPSGLDCDTGKPLGPTVRANHTVTFVAPKLGFANPEAKEWLGEVHVVDIGAPRTLLEQCGIAY